MAKLKLQTGADNEILRQKSKAVRKIDRAVQKLAKDMLETLERENGLGLAAPQVGKNIRLILVRLNHKTPHEMVVVMVNPEITAISTETEEAEEGCLSLPKLYGMVDRARAVTVEFETPKNDQQTLKLEGLNARVTQHEIDHLEGVLLVDRMKEETKIENS